MLIKSAPGEVAHQAGELKDRARKASAATRAHVSQVSVATQKNMSKICHENLYKKWIGLQLPSQASGD
jgi:hypothetical protein